MFVKRTKLQLSPFLRGQKMYFPGICQSNNNSNADKKVFVSCKPVMIVHKHSSTIKFMKTRQEEE